MTKVSLRQRSKKPRHDYVTPLIRKLHATTDALELHDVARQLRRKAPTHRDQVVTAFVEYMAAGRIDHGREFMAASAAKFVVEGDTRHAEAFRKGLNHPRTAYWSILGLARTLRTGSYPELVSFALDPRNDRECRAHAMKVLAGLSKQTFDRGLPTGPGDWPLEGFPLDEVARWRDEGFPKGRGFHPPVVSPALKKPKTDLDRIAARLEAKLKCYRADRQDLANPTDWLVPADPAQLAAVTKRWRLPARYVQFITRFSPLKVTIYGRGCGQGIELFGAADLIEAQYGYSYDPFAATAIEDWNPDHVVIAAEAGDPYVLDLTAVKNGDCPVLTARHGQGSWEFTQVTARFTSFLSRLARA